MAWGVPPCFSPGRWCCCWSGCGWVVGCCRFGYPLMLKAKTMAYDGKGNAVAKTEADVKDAFELLGACRQAGREGGVDDTGGEGAAS